MNEHIRKRISEHLDYYNKQYKNEWIGIFLQGSQNYGLDYEGSDVDTKIIVLPSLDDLILNKQPVSTTLILPNDEHCDVKDIRLMFECFKKQNINFLEILFTKQRFLNATYTNLFAPMFQYREAIAHYNNYAAVSCMCGMILEKHKALTKPHPSAQKVIDQYGYDGKQLHHIERLYEFLVRYTSENELFEKCLLSNERDRLISYKRQALSLESAVDLADKTMRKAQSLSEAYRKDHVLRVNHDVEFLMQNVLTHIFRLHFSRELSTMEV